jgi:hypothetical protein
MPSDQRSILRPLAGSSRSWAPMGFLEVIFGILLASQSSGSADLRIFDIAKPPLVIVHAYSDFDNCKSSAPELNHLIHRYQKANLPVVFLLSPGADSKNWITDHPGTELQVEALAGSHELGIYAREAVIAGAWFGQCHLESVIDAVRGHFRRNTASFTIHLPARAIVIRADSQQSPYLTGGIGRCFPTLSEFHQNVGHETFLRVVSAVLSDGKNLFPLLAREDGENYIRTTIGTLKDFTLRIYVDDVLERTFGSGPLNLNIKIWDHKRVPQMP